jgi:hypothetical protein
MKAPTRIDLGSVACLTGTNWFTLVVDGVSGFYVERYTDSSLPFVNGRLKMLPFADFKKYKINGVPLADLVTNKFRELNVQSGRREFDTQFACRVLNT